MNRFLIGKITRAHGLKGQLKLQSYTSKDFFSYPHFYDEKGHELKIQFISELKSGWYIISLPGVNTIHAAGQYAGVEIYGDRQSLEEDEFYYSDLAGAPIYDENQTSLGVIEEIHDYGASPYVVIKKEDGAMMNAFFHKEAIISIDQDKVIIKKEFLVV